MPDLAYWKQMLREMPLASSHSHHSLPEVHHGLHQRVRDGLCTVTQAERLA